MEACRNGHLRTAENTYIAPSGGARCRICRHHNSNVYQTSPKAKAAKGRYRASPKGKSTETRYVYDRAGGRRSMLATIKIESGCMDCGYAKDPVALDFDHRPETIKLFTIGGSLGARHVGIENLLDEVEKCDVRCANCHRIATHDRRQD